MSSQKNTSVLQLVLLLQCSNHPESVHKLVLIITVFFKTKFTLFKTLPWRWPHVVTLSSCGCIDKVRVCCVPTEVQPKQARGSLDIPGHTPGGHTPGGHTPGQTVLSFQVKNVCLECICRTVLLKMQLT